MAIHLKNLSFSYPEQPQQKVIDIEHWSLAQGEQVFLQGPSGCGKSTLLSLIGGLLVADAGEINVLGTDLTALSARERDAFRAQNIGFVFQQFNLIPYLSAVDNVRLALSFASQQKGNDPLFYINELFDQLAISQEDRHKATRLLSVGQQQRVAIVRALCNKPKLLIADEPTSALDQKNRDAFLSILKALTTEQKTSLLFVSHDLSLAKTFERTEQLALINQISGQN
ncbi:ABC transporter ATP-binding protein [Gayadomonas joobiniege]|uniref:ABC transporter ATP-binding protein n=1 Tax=Gayadomonas joobiniege TaxID=1234606 RepID=UPI000364592A|nr:ABC transporter ATP-binding protein [Gayadomonas joobiniege]